jgi:hypothetical protein
MASPSRCDDDLNDTPHMFASDETSTRQVVLAIEQVPGLTPADVYCSLRNDGLYVEARTQDDTLGCQARECSDGMAYERA